MQIVSRAARFALYYLIKQLTEKEEPKLIFWPFSQLKMQISPLFSFKI